MDIKQYKKNLEKLKLDLEKFDGNFADSDYKQLEKLFLVVYNSEVLDITQYEKTLQDSLKLELFTTLSQVSGTLSFLIIQILAAHNIMSKHNFAKKEFYFQKKCGIAINHLRAPRTIVEAKKVDDGYTLSGTLTWASGYKIFDTLLIGFHYNQYEHEAMASFSPQEGFEIGPSDETFVGYGLNTVNIQLNDFFVKDEDIVSSNPIGNYTKNKSASKTVHFCIYGLGICAINQVQDQQFKHNAQKKLEQIKSGFVHSNDIDELDNLRIDLFCLVQDIVTTAMILIGGKSVLSSQILQRVYRELIMFNSNGLNNTLKSLFKNKFIGNR